MSALVALGMGKGTGEVPGPWPCCQASSQVLWLAALTGAGASLSTAMMGTMRASQKCHCSCLSRVKIWMRTKAKKGCMSCSLFWTTSSHLHIKRFLSLRQKFCNGSSDYGFARESWWWKKTKLCSSFPSFYTWKENSIKVKWRWMTAL